MSTFYIYLSVIKYHNVLTFDRNLAFGNWSYRTIFLIKRKKIMIQNTKTYDVIRFKLLLIK